MPNFKPIRLLAAGAAMFAIAGLSSPSIAQEKSLYERLGGLPAIDAVSTDFVVALATDEKTAPRFTETNLSEFKRLLVNQICEATGGPCTYDGKTMIEAHKGMDVTPAEFQHTGAMLSAVLDKYKVPAAEKRQLLTAIGSMQNDIVGK